MSVLNEIHSLIEKTEICFTEGALNKLGYTAAGLGAAGMMGVLPYGVPGLGTIQRGADAIKKAYHYYPIVKSGVTVAKVAGNSLARRAEEYV